MMLCLVIISVPGINGLARDVISILRKAIGVLFIVHTCCMAGGSGYLGLMKCNVMHCVISVISG
tara:strand:+ start:1037 stop:1228 length:192 start_codon:yes stop_codon:yes gene_type:complete